MVTWQLELESSSDFYFYGGFGRSAGWGMHWGMGWDGIRWGATGRYAT